MPWILRIALSCLALLMGYALAVACTVWVLHRAPIWMYRFWGVPHLGQSIKAVAILSILIVAVYPLRQIYKSGMSRAISRR